MQSISIYLNNYFFFIEENIKTSLENMSAMHLKKIEMHRKENIFNYCP